MTDPRHLASILAGACHVGWSNMRVIRYVRSRMQKSVRKNPALRKTRKGIYRAVLRAHRKNQELVR